LFLSQGRFRDTYQEITDLIESEVLLPPKRLGSVVCAALIEGSTHAKTRASACETCLVCVEKAGLAGVGKKGVMAAAKLLSQETTKYRSSALDLMEAIFLKMNSDMQRLVRICGPNLTDKARQLLEDRVAQGRPARGSSPAPARTPAHQRSPSGSPIKSQRRNVSKEPAIYDELPKLSLRSWKKSQRSSPPNRETSLHDSDDPFANSLSAFREMPPPSPAKSEELEAGDGMKEPILSTKPVVEPSGAAAALRARLLKIREGTSAPVASVGGGGRGSADEARSGSATFVGIVASGSASASTDFDVHLETIRTLLNKVAPLSDKDDELVTCIKSLKVFHAALARQQHSSINLTVGELADMRKSLVENMDTVVDILRK